LGIICESGHENVDGAFYCEICGMLLSKDSAAHKAVRVCSRCGSPNQPSAIQCENCEMQLLAEPVAGDDPAVVRATLGAMLARLVVLSDGTTFELPPTREIVIGRADPTSDSYPDIDLTGYGGEDGGVSRIHAIIRVNNGHFMLEDQQSTNFTFLNKQRLEPYTPTTMKSGDELRLGRIMIRFEFTAS